MGSGRLPKVTIQNQSAQPVRIIGGHADCSCVIAEELPITVGPGKKAEVPIRFRYPPLSTGQF